jgi:hypothetical protein
LKRAGTILILVILLSNGTGFYVYYFLRLQDIRAEMRERLKLLPDEELEVLTLTREEYRKSVVEENEVKVNGKMYDVARVKISGRIVRVYCVHDEKEDNLLAFAAELLSAPMKEKPSVPVQIFQFIGLNFILPTSDFDINNSGALVSIATPYGFALTEVCIQPSAPPPRASAS